MRKELSHKKTAASRAAGIVASLGVIVITVLVIEVVLRFSHLFGARLSWVEPDPEIGFRYTAGRTYWNLAENDHPITGRINSHGWRDRERPIEKPQGTYRVAFIGDSFVVGFEVESDSTFLARAEDGLTASLGAPVEILNFGRTGATQTEELIVLEREVMKFSPDLVAVLFVPQNDVRDVARATNTSVTLRPFYEIGPGGDLLLDTSFNTTRSYRTKAAINTLKQRSALVSLVAERYNLFMETRQVRTQVAAEQGTPRRLSLCTSRPDSVYAKNYELNKILIGKMAEYCRQRGVRFLLVCDAMVYQPEDIRKRVAADPTFDPDFFEKDLARYADSLGADFLGLQTPFREHAAVGGAPLHWVHYNYDGHRVVARALTGKLAGIIPEAAR